MAHGIVKYYQREIWQEGVIPIHCFLKLPKDVTLPNQEIETGPEAFVETVIASHEILLEKVSIAVSSNGILRINKQ